MRKVIIVSGISIILAIIAVISTILFINIYFPAIGTFSLEDYKSEIEYFSSNNNVGDVNNAYTAIKKAKDLWIEKFYKVANGKATNPLKWKNFKVEYDSKNE